MGSSRGPCNHCGATSSPQWRKGPRKKPVLCNACGLRSRRGTLVNDAPTERLRGPNKRIRKSDATVHNQGNLSAVDDVPSCAAHPTSATKCTSLSVISSPQNSPILLGEADEDEIPGNSTDLSHFESVELKDTTAKKLITTKSPSTSE